MKAKFPKPISITQLVHRGSKKLSQQGTEFFHEEKEVRKQPTRGFSGRKG